MPLGTQGKALAFINNAESILAAWYLLRRGCKIIFFNTNKSNINFLQYFISNWYLDSYIITNEIEGNLFINLNKIALEENCNAIITGHTFVNTGAVISDIKKIKIYIDLPLFHPLIAMGKNEIKMKCNELGIPL
jgi:adenylyl- and sulfurtransferase ThiI